MLTLGAFLSVLSGAVIGCIVYLPLQVLEFEYAWIAGALADGFIAIYCFTLVITVEENQ